MDEPVTWDQLIEAAEQTGTTMAVQGRKNESLMVWVNALVESAGGSILAPDQENVPAVDVEPTINSEAGADAADHAEDRRLVRGAARSALPVRRSHEPRSRPRTAASWSTGRTSGPPSTPASRTAVCRRTSRTTSAGRVTRRRSRARRARRRSAASV